MKNKLFIIILLTVLLIPYKAKAFTGNLSISCSPTTIKAEDTTSCTITGTTDEEIVAISSEIVLSSNLSSVTFEPSSTWNENDISNNKIEVYSENDVNGSFTLGVLKVKAKKGALNTNETLTLKNTTFQNDKSNDPSVNTHSIDDVSVALRTANNDSKLKSLSVDGHKLDKDFSKDVTKYSLSTTKDSIVVNATTNDTNATVTGTGTIKLVNGENDVKIKVIAEDGSETVYTITAIAKLSNIRKPDENKQDDGNSKGNEKTDKTLNELDNNSKTGDATIIVIIAIAVIALAVSSYFVIKKNKKEKNVL